MASATSANPARSKPSPPSPPSRAGRRPSAALRVLPESPEQSLTHAFHNFKQTAEALERSYGQLQSEVLRLRHELERTNHDLASSVEENRRMRDYLGRILENLPCGVLVAGPEGEPRLANPEAQRLLSLGATKPDGEDCTPPAKLLREAVAQWNAKPMRAQKGSEVEIEMAGGRSVGVACMVLGDDESQGFPSESVFLLRDVTEQKRAAAEREAAKRRESLAQLATLLAHEIRNPLGSLELFAGLLADAAAEQPNLRRWTDHIQAGLRGLSATVNNVLHFHTQPEPQLADVNLGRLLRDSADFLRPLARQAGLRIELENSLGEIEIRADAHRLQQAFFNLALNAFRAMAVGGALTMRLRWSDPSKREHVAIEFQDTGRGIASENLARIFEPGFTTTAGQPGIGLAVCRTVIEQHGGLLNVASEAGLGARFEIVLPRSVGRRKDAA